MSIVLFCCIFFLFKQKTAYEMRISDWSSDVCFSDLMNISNTMHHLRYRADAAIGEIERRLIRFSQRNSNYLSHAKDEWAIAFPGDDEMQAQMGEHVLDMVAMFGLEGHSGFSASYARQYIDKIGKASCRERVCQYV